LEKLKVGSLLELKEASQQSKHLSDGLEKMRSQLLFPGSLSKDKDQRFSMLVKLAAELQSLDNLLVIAEEELSRARSSWQVLQQLAKSTQEKDLPLLAPRFEDLRNSVRYAHKLLQSANASSRKILEEMAAQQFRPDTLHLLKAARCNPLEEISSKDFESIGQTLSEVHKAFQAGQADKVLQPNLKTQLDQVHSRMEAASALPIGRVIFNLVIIEREQLTQTQELQTLQQKLENDLLKVLLGK
jgi:hypothetical protein